ncbi:MAG: flagellar basal body rod protein FlgB [Gammaproteobacteria bacterium]
MSIIDKVFGVHGQALILRSKRAEVLASNLANVDTPNYKARDLDFQSALDEATSTLTVVPQSSHAAHFSTANGSVGSVELRYRVPLQPSLDGNTVDAQIEKEKFAENAVRYSASLQFLNARIVGLLRVLREE